jgi:hypothetical protein
MPRFEVEEIWIDPYEYVSACNTRELNQLIECLVEDGLVMKISEGANTISDSQWARMLEHLSGLNLQMSVDDEATIKAIIKKYDATSPGC